MVAVKPSSPISVNFAELTVHSHGDILRASDETDDLYTTLDQVMQKLEAAAQRQKERTNPPR